MQYMPLFVDMRGRKVLIIGGGEVALRKARQFAEAGTQITIVAPEIKKEFKDLPCTSLEIRKAVPADISKEYFAVIFASNDKEANESLSKICKEKCIIADRCDDHSKSDFVTGSITRSGSIINATVSCGIPSLSRFISHEVEKLFTPELQKLNELLTELRPAIIASKKADKAFLSRIVTKENLDRINKEGINQLRQEILACL